MTQPPRLARRLLAELLDSAFLLAAIRISNHHRASPAQVFSGVIAIGGPLLVILALARTKRSTSPRRRSLPTPAPLTSLPARRASPPQRSRSAACFRTRSAGSPPPRSPACITARAIGGAVWILIVHTLYPDVTAGDAATVLVPYQQDGRADQAEPLGATPSLSSAR